MMWSLIDKKERAEEQITIVVQPHDLESTGNIEHTPFGSGSTPTDNEITMATYREESAIKQFWRYSGTTVNTELLEDSSLMHLI